MVSEVKDQGSCGSCWAFSTTGSIESAFKIKNGSDILLSEQQLVDCTISYGNNGCNGGLVEYAYHYLENVPLETEAQYPYSAKNLKCSAAAMSGDVSVTDFKEVERFSPTQLAQALTLGPVSVGVDASGLGFQTYKSGIIKKFCGTSIDHAVLAVGYGTEDNDDYWLVKNSWGAKWGENGYFRVLRDMTKNDEGMCGIQQTPTYPIL
jgi:C1A family cysteine protease